MTGALTNVERELQQFHTLALQNWWALDYLLASEISVCSLIETECCTLGDDNTLSLDHHVCKLQKLQAALQGIIWDKSGLGSLFE